MGAYEDGFSAGFAAGVRYANDTISNFGMMASSDSTPQRSLIRATKDVRRKRRGRPDPKMAKALKKANSMMRTKSGKLRKGKSQADIMRKAHQLRRKMR